MRRQSLPTGRRTVNLSMKAGAACKVATSLQKSSRHSSPVIQAWRIISTIERLRLVNAETAIEDGTEAVEPARAGAPGTSRYTVVHVKRDGKWLMWSVRETRIDTPSNYGHLEDLENMIGTWVAENQGVEFEVTCRWIANKNFIEQNFRSQQGSQTIASGTQIIGWDPAKQRITSWAFTSEGGHAVGLWRPHDTGWLVESAGTLIDGTPTSAVNILTRLDDNAVMWRSVNRTAGASGFSTPMKLFSNASRP